MNRVVGITNGTKEQGSRMTTANTFGWWIFLNILGGVCGMIMLRLTSNTIRTDQRLVAVLFEGLTWSLLGLGVGVAQWTLLRRWFRPLSLWIPATAIAVGVAFPLLSTVGGQLLGLKGAIYLLIIELGLGLLVGAAQFLILRKQDNGAAWWFVATTLAWPVQHFAYEILTRLSDRGRVALMGWQEIVGWAMYGIITGIALVSLTSSRTSRNEVV